MHDGLKPSRARGNHGMVHLQLIAAAVVVATLVSACSPGQRDSADSDSVDQARASPPASPAAARVDGERIENADREPGNWMSYGRTYDEQRFSPLTAINTANAARLGLAWSYDLDTAARAQESTPLVIDGVMYVTSAPGARSSRSMPRRDASSGFMIRRSRARSRSMHAATSSIAASRPGTAGCTSARSMGGWSRSMLRPAGRCGR